MRFDLSLDDIFRNRSHVRVLRALHRLPQGLSGTGREIARRAGVSHPTALKTLVALTDTGISQVRRGPVGDAYELNRDHALTGLLVEFFEWEDAAIDELASFLRDEILARTDRVQSAALFGSVVWGQASPTSDIDLAVICSARDRSDVEAVLEDLDDAVKTRFGNHLSPLLRASGRGPVKSGRRLWNRIETEGVPVIEAQGAGSR